MVTELRSREYKVGCASGFVSIGRLRFSLLNVGWLFLKLCEYKVAGFRFGECELAVFLLHRTCLRVYMRWGLRFFSSINGIREVNQDGQCCMEYVFFY